MPYSPDRKFSCVYHIRCSDGRTYIGATNDFLIRRNKHLYDLRHRRHPNAVLQGAWDEMGEGQFVVEPVVLCGESDLRLEEQKLLDVVFAEGTALNIATDADCAARGLSPSPETRQKLSEATKGRPQSLEHSLKISRGRRAVPHVLSRRDTGERTSVVNMRRWCRENGLSRSHIMSVIRGDRKSHKGWVTATA